MAAPATAMIIIIIIIMGNNKFWLDGYSNNLGSGNQWEIKRKWADNVAQ